MCIIRNHIVNRQEVVVRVGPIPVRLRERVGGSMAEISRVGNFLVDLACCSPTCVALDIDSFSCHVTGEAADPIGVLPEAGLPSPHGQEDRQGGAGHGMRQKEVQAIQHWTVHKCVLPQQRYHCIQCHCYTSHVMCIDRMHRVCVLRVYT